MSSEETNQAPLSFQVVDSAGVRSTLELVETFRLLVKGRVRDYCLVRPLPAGGQEPAGDDTEDEDELALTEEGRGGRDDDAEELQAYRLEDDGLASLEPGEETILMGQALLALQNVAWQDDEEEEGEEQQCDEPHRARH
ncbi:MAG: hypothetical protein FJ125_09375 [Deltaproteobacteria bacterium]|nr:hypothetical protein [Deltaproteobacteria bacterium]